MQAGCGQDADPTRPVCLLFIDDSQVPVNKMLVMPCRGWGGPKNVLIRAGK